MALHGPHAVVGLIAQEPTRENALNFSSVHLNLLPCTTALHNYPANVRTIVFQFGSRLVYMLMHEQLLNSAVTATYSETLLRQPPVGQF